MHNQMKIFITMSGIVLMFVFCDCRKIPSEPPIDESILAGKAFFTGPTPVSQHHGIQVIAYLKSDTVLTALDTTVTDTTGFYSFGKPSVDGVYLLIAYYLFYYRDTVEVKFQSGRREGEIRHMHIRQKVQVRFKSEKAMCQLTDKFTFTAEVANISQETLLLPNMSWFDYYMWNFLIFISIWNDSLRFGYASGTMPGHGSPCGLLEPGVVMTLTRSVYIGFFTDKEGKQHIIPGRYKFYAMVKGCLPLERNGRLLPLFEPAEVEIIP